MLTQQDKKTLIEAFKSIDVRRLEIELDDERAVKMFRFGSYNGLQIATEIVKLMPERKTRKKETNGHKQSKQI